jgi:ribosomal protein L18E
MSVCCECCVLSGTGLCDELITRPEESYRLWRVVVCDLETSRMRRPWLALGRSATGKKTPHKFVRLVGYVISSVLYVVYVRVPVINFSYGTCDLLHMH